MRKTAVFSTFLAVSLFLGLHATARAQGALVPAGTLLHCTMQEPNFSSATASVGDPVLCYLNGVQEFGYAVFPRGSYLQGHLAADKEPGHFFGKGYLKFEFDRLFLPSTDVPLPAKVISAANYRVNKDGDVVGRGHAKRDAAEWLFPPLWPWKAISLPARGSRPALKGEQKITLRLMDDILVPRATASNAPFSPTLAPGWHYFGSSGQRTPRSSNDSESADVPRNSAFAASAPEFGARVTTIALKSNETYSVTSYRTMGGRLSYVLLDGTTGAVSVDQIDWLKTSQLNAERRVVAGNDASLLAKNSGN